MSSKRLWNTYISRKITWFLDFILHRLLFQAHQNVTVRVFSVWRYIAGRVVSYISKNRSSFILSPGWSSQRRLLNPENEDCRQYRTESNGDVFILSYSPQRFLIWEIVAFLGCYTTWIGIYVPTFRDNPYSPFQRSSSPRISPSWSACSFKMGPTGYLETSVHK